MNLNTKTFQLITICKVALDHTCKGPWIHKLTFDQQLTGAWFSNGKRLIRLTLKREANREVAYCTAKESLYGIQIKFLSLNCPVP